MKHYKFFSLFFLSIILTGCTNVDTKASENFSIDEVANISVVVQSYQLTIRESTDDQIHVKCILHIFIDPKGRFCPTDNPQPLCQQGRTCFINIARTAYFTPVTLFVMHLQRIVLMPTFLTGPNGPFTNAGGRKILAGRTAADHVKWGNCGLIDLCNISQIQRFICAMDRTVTLYCILIKFTKIHQTIFHSPFS